MPLHRDIHWIGRQWAVTGHGMQLIDQKLQGFFDIEVARLWDDILIESVHAKTWLNRADFDKGLALARTRYPQSPGAEILPRNAEPLPAVEPIAPVATAIEPKQEAPKLETPKLAAEIPQGAAIPKPASIDTARVEVKPPEVTTRAPVEPPAVMMPPQQAAPPPAIQTAGPLPQVVNHPELKPAAAKFETPKPAPPTAPKPASTETPAAITPRLQVSSSSAVVSAPPSPRPPDDEHDAPERVVFVRPGVIEPLRAVAEPASVIGTTPAPAAPARSLFQMRYAGRARFVRPWRVVARKI